MFRSFIALASSTVFTLHASAATVYVDLDVEPAGTFRLTLEASPEDNFGIASYGIPLAGGITTLQHVSPLATILQGGPAGFTLFRSPHNALLVGASQDTITPSPHLIRGFGQTPGLFPPIGIPEQQISWHVPLLIATGTWQGIEPGIDTDNLALFANVFSEPTGIRTMSAAIVLAAIPEPPTIALGTLSLLGMLWLVQRRSGSTFV